MTTERPEMVTGLFRDRQSAERAYERATGRGYGQHRPLCQRRRLRHSGPQRRGASALPPAGRHSGLRHLWRWGSGSTGPAGRDPGSPPATPAPEPAELRRVICYARGHAVNHPFTGSGWRLWTGRSTLWATARSLRVQEVDLDCSLLDRSEP